MQSLQRFLLVMAVLLALLCAVGAIASGFGTRLGWWDFGFGFAILKWSVYLAGAAVVLAIIAAILAKLIGSGLKDYRYLVVLLTGLLVFGIPYLTVKEFRKTPTLADATTNFEDPPQFVALLPVREEKARNPLQYLGDEAADLQRQYFPDLNSMQLDQSPEEVVNKAVNVAKEMGMEVVASNPQEGRLEATATTFWFGFKDDLVMRARALPNGWTRIDVRSASRVGRLDGGVNGKRVQRFLQMLSTEMQP